MFPRRCSPRLTLLVASMVLALASLGPTVARSQELITPRVKDRKFPQGLFCPINLDLAFTANGPSATIRFSTANVFFFNTDFSEVQWTQQALDNICVAPLKVYNAHLVDPESYSSECYVGELVPKRFAFQDAGVLPLKDTFDSNGTDPATRGWDLSHGAYWDQS